jgi:hypothetical protein
MRQIDMSREAVTARLKLVSQLRRLCLSLGTSKMRVQPAAKDSKTRDLKSSAESHDYLRDER